MPKRGESLVVDGRKLCLGCEKRLPVSDFKEMDRPNRPGGPYYYPRCDECRKKYHREYYQGRRKEDPTYGRESNRRSVLKRHGLSPEDFDRMLEEQDGKCAICGKPPGTTDGVDRNRLVIDHSHATGKARALLCDFCNRGLGIFFDDPELLVTAAGYLRRFEGSDESSCLG